MFRNLKLSAKLIGAITLVLSITSGISFWILQSRINAQADEAFRDKLRQITGMASATRNWFARQYRRHGSETITSSTWSRCR